MLVVFGILLFCSSTMLAVQKSKTSDRPAAEEKTAANAEQEPAYLTLKGNEQLFELMNAFCHKKTKLFSLKKHSVLFTNQPVLSTNKKYLFFLQSVRKVHTREIEPGKQFSSNIIHQYLYYYSVRTNKLHHCDLYDSNFFHGGFCFASISPNNNYLLVMARNRAVAPLLWNHKEKRGTPLEIFDNQTTLHHAAWSPNGQFIAFILEKNSGERQLTAFAIYDREKQKVRFLYEDYYEMRHSIFTSIAWSCNGLYIIGATKDAMIYIHHTTTDKFTRKALKKNIAQLCCAPDSAHVAAVSEDNMHILVLHIAEQKTNSLPAEKTEKPCHIQWHSSHELCILSENFLIIWDIIQDRKIMYRWKPEQTDTPTLYPYCLIAQEKMYQLSDTELRVGTVPPAGLFKLSPVQIDLIKTILNTPAASIGASEYQDRLPELHLPQLWKQILLEHLQSRESVQEPYTKLTEEITHV